MVIALHATVNRGGRVDCVERVVLVVVAGSVLFPNVVDISSVVVAGSVLFPNVVGISSVAVAMSTACNGGVVVVVSVVVEIVLVVELTIVLETVLVVDLAAVLEMVAEESDGVVKLIVVLVLATSVVVTVPVVMCAGW